MPFLKLNKKKYMSKEDKDFWRTEENGLPKQEHKRRATSKFAEEDQE